MKKTIYSQDSKILTNALRNGRKAQGLTMRQLAEKMDVHHSVIGKIETGERRLDVIEFIEYCNILGIEPNNIINAIIGKSK